MRYRVRRARSKDGSRHEPEHAHDRRVEPSFTLVPPPPENDRDALGSREGVSVSVIHPAP